MGLVFFTPKKQKRLGVTQKTFRVGVYTAKGFERRLLEATHRLCNDGKAELAIRSMEMQLQRAAKWQARKGEVVPGSSQDYLGSISCFTATYRERRDGRMANVLQFAIHMDEEHDERVQAFMFVEKTSAAAYSPKPSGWLIAISSLNRWQEVQNAALQELKQYLGTTGRNKFMRKTISYLAGRD